MDKLLFLVVQFVISVLFVVPYTLDASKEILYKVSGMMDSLMTLMFLSSLLSIISSLKSVLFDIVLAMLIRKVWFSPPLNPAFQVTIIDDTLQLAVIFVGGSGIPWRENIKQYHNERLKIDFRILFMIKSYIVCDIKTLCSFNCNHTGLSARYM